MACIKMSGQNSYILNKYDAACTKQRQRQRVPNAHVLHEQGSDTMNAQSISALTFQVWHDHNPNPKPNPNPSRYSHNKEVNCHCLGRNEF